MKNATIIYSPVNLDSCMATIILREKLLEKGSPLVETIPYARWDENNKQPSADSDIHILGADLSADYLAEIMDNAKNDTASLSHFESSTIEESPPQGKKIVYHAYINGTIYNSRLVKRMEELNVEIIRFQKIEGDIGNQPEHSISLRLLNPSLDEKATPLVKLTSLAPPSAMQDLANAVNLFCRFKKMTRDETYLVYVNINEIKKYAALSAKTYKPFTIARPGETTHEFYADYVTEFRQLLFNNTQHSLYAGANGTAFETPTFNVGERDAMHCMRYKHYSSTEVISYEEKRNCRVYRILADTNTPWYVKRFEPSDVWSEGALLCLKTEIPKHMR